MTDTPSPAEAELIAAARDAATHAHAPYSGFHVGAALRLKNGDIITGCNLENASYGMTLCAEAVALGTANAAGHLRNVAAIAIIGGRPSPAGLSGSQPTAPCGRCRQMLMEAAQLAKVKPFPVICASGDGTRVDIHTLGGLLPHAFGPADLDIH